jgi:hypothetical protein
VRASSQDSQHTLNDLHAKESLDAAQDSSLAYYEGEVGWLRLSVVVTASRVA